MATNTFVAIYLPEAADLADLRGISIDLASARSHAERLKKIFERNQDFDLVEVLTTAILVSYSRPFAKGVRKRLQKDALHVLSDEERDCHLYLRNIRDKHIAHSVNAFEENQPIARYWVERVQNDGIESIECQHSSVIGLSPRDVDAVISITSKLMSHVDARIDHEKSRLLELVRRRPLDEILSGEYPPPSPTSPAVARRNRKRLGGV